MQWQESSHRDARRRRARQAALASISAGDNAAAYNALQDFISHASALSGKQMTTSQGITRITESTLIRSALRC